MFTLKPLFTIWTHALHVDRFHCVPLTVQLCHYCVWVVSSSEQGWTRCAPPGDSSLTECWGAAWYQPGLPAAAAPHRPLSGELTLTLALLAGSGPMSGHSQPKWRSLPLRLRSPNRQNWGSFEIQRKFVIKYLHPRQNIFQVEFMAAIKIQTWLKISLL